MVNKECVQLRVNYESAKHQDLKFAMGTLASMVAIGLSWYVWWNENRENGLSSMFRLFIDEEEDDLVTEQNSFLVFLLFVVCCY